MTELRRMRRAGVFSLLLAGSLGCPGSGTTPDPEPVPATLRVGPSEPSVADGGTTRLTATVRDQNGGVIATLPGGAAVAWTSGDAAVASVDATGLVSALRPGTSWVRASVGAVADSTRVTVTAVPTQLAVVGSASRVGTAGRPVSESLAVRVTDRHGLAVDGVTVAFAAANGGEVAPATAVTGADGTARTSWRLGATPGPQAATATVTGLAGSPATFHASAAAPVPAAVAVAPAFATVAVGATQALAATVLSTDGDPIPNTPVAWTSTGTAVATVTPGGTVTGVAPGLAGVAASANALSDTAMVAVLGPNSLLATAFPGGAIRADVRRGDTVRVPVILDLSRPSPSGALGSVQLDVVYDPAVLQFVRADNFLPGSVTNLRMPGRFGIAFAAAHPEGSGTIRFATIVLVVRPDAATGAVSRFQTEFVEAPRSTLFVPFAAPVVVAGRVRVR